MELDSRWQYGFKIEFNENLTESCSYPLDDKLDDKYTDNCVIEKSGKKFHFLNHDGKTYELVRLHNKLSVEDYLALFSQSVDNFVRLWFITDNAYYVVYENTSIKFAY